MCSLDLAGCGPADGAVYLQWENEQMAERPASKYTGLLQMCSRTDDSEQDGRRVASV